MKTAIVQLDCQPQPALPTLANRVRGAWCRNVMAITLASSSLIGCGGGGAEPTLIPPATEAPVVSEAPGVTETPGVTDLTGGTEAAGSLVGVAGMAAWDALASDQKARINTTMRSFFLHQSVGGDLEDGAQALGFKFEYADSRATSLAAGLNGGLFASSNGNPTDKVAEFRTMALANRNGLGVAIMKFGYADIVTDKLATAQADYLAAVNTLRAQGIRVLHVTPPLVFNVPDENAPKMQMRTWMMSSFSQDTIFDLQDLESTEPTTGARCERGGSWEICGAVRSTAACPSKGQGEDAPSGQGHLCFNPHAQRLAKAFLYAIYRSQL